LVAQLTGIFEVKMADEIQESIESEKLDLRLKKVGIGGYRRHFILCVGESCSRGLEPGTAEESWAKLKKLLSEHQITPTPVFRTKCHCLRVCRQGPIGVIYPEGIWYQALNSENVERVVKEHLIENRIVEDLVIAKNPLG